MHTVTKVLVVFAAILCVLLAALTMAYSVNVDRITADYNRQVQLRTTTDATANAQMAQAKDLDITRQETIAKLNNDLTRIGTEVSSLQAERSALIKDKSDAVNAAAEITSKIDQLAATAKTQALLIESYRNEVTKLRESELVYRQREIELVDRLNDLESQREVLEASVRALRENLEEARRAVELAGTGGDRKTGGPIRPSFPISAKIVQTEVDKATGKSIATINVGTNNQIRENMQLTIVRDGAFVADFLVTQADLQWSKGVIDTYGAVDAQKKPVQVRAGDTVKSLVSR